jgi:hypothetical protein
MDAEQQPQQQPAQEARPEATQQPGKAGRKPPSPEQAKLAAERKRLKRRLEKLLAEGDAAALAAAAAKLEGEGEREAPAAPSEDAPAALEKAPEKPAAPTAEETAAMVPVAQSMVAMLAAPLAGTRYDPMRPKPNPLGGEDIVPARALTEALAPVLAKYLPAAITTPEGQLAMVTLMWLGPPTLELVMEKVRAEDGNASKVEGAGTRAG